MPWSAPYHKSKDGVEPVKTHKQKVADKEGARQYPTYSRTWRKMRLAYLVKESLCRHCAGKGLAVVATDVDHIDGDSWNNSEDNYQALCHSCHSRKTAKQNNGKDSRFYHK